MIQYICDRCGKLIPEEQEPFTIGLDIDEFEEVRGEILHLCRDCEEELKKFLKLKPKGKKPEQEAGSG